MLHNGLLFQGFLRVFDDMADIVLDVPLAYITLNRFMERCQTRRFLTERVHNEMPTRYASHLSSDDTPIHHMSLNTALLIIHIFIPEELVQNIHLFVLLILLDIRILYIKLVTILSLM